MYLKMVQIRQSIAVHAGERVYVHESLQGLHIAMRHQLTHVMLAGQVVNHLRVNMVQGAEHG